jgi:hypothetical protein
MKSDKAARPASLAIRNPNILYLCCVLQEPSTFALSWIEPIDAPAFIGKYLFQISCGKRFRSSGARFVCETPDRIYVIMFGESLEKLRRVSGDDIHCATRQVTGVENLVQVSDRERITF